VERKIATIPNAITFLGLICVFASAYAVREGRYTMAEIFFLLVIASDFFDGFFARLIEKRSPGWGVSPLGEVLDPVRDKCVILVVLAFDPVGALLIGLIESVSVVYAGKLRGVMRRHHVTWGSKAVTAGQAVFIFVMLLMEDRGAALIPALAWLSLGRLVSYSGAYESVKTN